ncbi:MAG: threonylcarbamoyl-AMP synthase [Deltaproteobacteria bacterium]|nr:threonylcarbamoyl-AMP synthase [Deltaproteobacteria bacterium]
MTGEARPLDLAGAAALLRAGGIVAYPTETFYGLGALWHRREALQRLAAAKLRPAGKPLPLLCADRAQLAEVAGPLPPAAERLAARFWPGPLTLVLPAAAGVPEEITAGTATVGARIPGCALARALASAAGGALVSTSANPSGGPPPRRAGELAPEILAAIDGVLDGGATPGGLPSTVVALGRDGPALVRAGVIPWDAVQGALRDPH